MRDVAPGHIQHGTAAAHEANNVISRVSTLDGNTKPDGKMLAAFDKRLTAIDARVAELIETGIRNSTILRRKRLPRIDLDSPNLVKPVRERVAPIEHVSNTELLTIVRTQLRPAPLDPSPDAARSRADLYSAIVTETAPRKRHIAEESPERATDVGLPPI